MRILVSETHEPRGSATELKGRRAPWPLGREIDKVPTVSGGSGYRTRDKDRDVIAGADITPNGRNTAVRIGTVIDTSGAWTQVAYVVLTPPERRALIAELCRQERAYNPHGLEPDPALPGRRVGS
jgi:hypothetical protein